MPYCIFASVRKYTYTIKVELSLATHPNTHSTRRKTGIGDWWRSLNYREGCPAKRNRRFGSGRLINQWLTCLSAALSSISWSFKDDMMWCLTVLPATLVALVSSSQPARHWPMSRHWATVSCTESNDCKDWASFVPAEHRPLSIYFQWSMHSLPLENHTYEIPFYI